MKIIPKNINEKLVFALQIILARLINNGKNLSKLQFSRILCIKLDEIGDLCYSLHVFDLLKQQYPNATITLMCRSYCNSLVQHHPAITNVVNNWQQLADNYDLIVDLRGSWKSIWFSLQNIPKAYIERGSVRLNNKQRGHPHEVFTNLQIIQPLFSVSLSEPKPMLYTGADNKKQAADFLLNNNITDFVIIHTGARKPLKKWSKDRFALICQWIYETYKFDIVFAGDTSEEHEISAIQTILAFKTYSIAGRLNLSDFAALVKMAKLYLGNDSGPLSIASISGTPSIGLYGPGVPVVFYPYGKKTDYIHHIMPCNPCNQINCVNPDNNCMDKITEAEVKLKITTLLQ